VRIVTVAHDRDCAIKWRHVGAAASRVRNDTSLVELEDWICCTDARSDWAKFDSHLELMRIVWKNVDEVSDLDLALRLVEFTALRTPSVRIVLLRHDLVLDSVLEGISVKTTVAAPRCMIAVKDLLRRQVLHITRLQVGITLNRIDR